MSLKSIATHSSTRTASLMSISTQTDLLPTLSGGPPSASDTDLVTITCSSRFNVSAGAEAVGITQREYTILAVPSGSSGTTNIFSRTGGSAIHPVPLAMMHYRLTEYGNIWGWQAGLGVAANIKSNSSGGSAAEYFFGVGPHVLRTACLSLGVHLGQTQRLAGGYPDGQQVPSAITSPPISTSYKVGYGIALTFSKP